MTALGGLVAAFDGNTNQTGSECAAKTSSPSAFVGKTLASASAIHRIVAYSSTDQDFRVNATGDVTLELYGKQGLAPSNSTDGTLLGSELHNDGATQSVVTVNSSDTTTLWDHVWLRLFPPVDSSQRVAELEIWAPA